MLARLEGQTVRTELSTVNRQHVVNTNLKRPENKNPAGEISIECLLSLFSALRALSALSLNNEMKVTYCGPLPVVLTEGAKIVCHFN